MSNAVISDSKFLTVKVIIDELELQALIDTGSSISLIDKKIVDSSNLELLTTQVQVKVANGTTTSSSGLIKTVGIIDCERIKLNLHVLKGLPFDLILGMDFLRDTKAFISFSERKIKFLSTKCRIPAPINFVSCEEFVSYAIIAEKTVIPARSEAFAKIHLSDKIFSEAFLLEGLSTLNEDLLVAPSLHTSNAKCNAVRIANVSTVPITLYRNTKVGEITPMPKNIAEAEEAKTATNDISKIMEEINFCPDLTSRQKKEFKKLVKQHRQVFPSEEKTIGRTTVLEHEIKLKPDSPVIFSHPFRRSYSEREDLRQHVDKLIKQDIVQHSDSPYSSPCFLVKKPDGKNRFVCDFRKLNANLIKDPYPLPRMDDTISALGGATLFSTLDLTQGFHQVPLTKDSCKYTAFSTPDLHCEYKVLPMGAANSPSTFSRLMNKVLKGILWKYCLCYLDDVVVYSTTWEEHLIALTEVFQKLGNAGLMLSPKKCNIGFSSLKFLGHIVSAEGVRPNQDKVLAIKEMPRPDNKKKLKSFLGMCAFYRKFVKDFSQVAKCLYTLTADHSEFEWQDTHTEAFNKLKDALCTAPVLAYPDFTHPFIIATDASGDGIGGVLKQKIAGKERPIAYASRALSEAEKKYPITEQEALAVVFCLQQFRSFVYGQRFQVITDHAALRWLLTAIHKNHRLSRWCLKIQDLDCTITYKPGRLNSDADALSRNPIRQGLFDFNPHKNKISLKRKTPTVAYLTKIGRRKLGDLYDKQIIVTQREDKFIRDIIFDLNRPRQLLKKSRQKYISKFQVINSVLYRVSKHPQSDVALVIPAGYKDLLIPRGHDDPHCGHLGYYKTLMKLSLRYWWRHMSHDIENYVKSCPTCQVRSKVKNLPFGQLMPISPGEVPFQKISIDKIGPFPCSQNKNKYALVVVDTLTKYVVIKATPNGTGLETAKFLWDDVFINFGAAKQLISDRGTEFVNNVVKDINDLLEVRHKTTSAYHPQADGQTERFMRTLSSLIIKFIAEKDQSDWDAHLKQFQFAYNTSTHSTTGYSPFFALHAYEPNAPADVEIDNQALSSSVLSSTEIISIREFIKEKGKEMQQAMKQRYDQNKVIKEFFPLDKILIYRPSKEIGNAAKITPCQHKAVVLSQVNPNNYRVQFTETDRIDVVNISQMKPFIPRTRVSFDEEKMKGSKSIPTPASTYPPRSILKAHDVKKYVGKKASKIKVAFQSITPLPALNEGESRLSSSLGSSVNESSTSENVSLGPSLNSSSGSSVTPNEATTFEQVPSGSGNNIFPNLSDVPTDPIQLAFERSGQLEPVHLPDLSTTPGPIDPVAIPEPPREMISPITPASDNSYQTLSPSPPLALSEAFVESPVLQRRPTPIPKRTLDFSTLPVPKKLKNANFVDTDILGPSMGIVKLAMAAVFLQQQLLSRIRLKTVQSETEETETSRTSRQESRAKMKPVSTAKLKGRAKQELQLSH